MGDLMPFFGDRSSLMRSMSDEIDRALNSVFGKEFLPTSLARSSYPKMNIYEDNEKLHIDAYIPEVSKDDVSIEFKDDILTIKGKAASEKEINNEQYYCREVSKKAFSRSIKIPSEADLDKIKAEHKDGMLKVIIPLPVKKEKTGKTIKIQ